MNKPVQNPTGLAIAIALTLIAALSLTAAAAEPAGTVQVQILAINDFHGHLKPPSGSSGEMGAVPAGGAEYLATHLNALRKTNPNTVVVSAGDLIGASPLLSALFHNEPTITACNRMGLNYSAVGNHEFDEGRAELLRLARGGCHPVAGCLAGAGFKGASFQYLAANVMAQPKGETLFPAYRIRSFNGVNIAFIGVSLNRTPELVNSSGIAGLNFLDEATTVNRLVPRLKTKGVKAIVVLIHEGGAQTPPAPYDGCEGISGRIVDIVNRFDPEVDVVISGHTHKAYQCMINNMLVTSAAAYGVLVTDIELTISRKTGQVVHKTAHNRIVDRTVAKDNAITDLIGKYEAVAAPLANRVVGAITANITRSPSLGGESALGDVIADGQLYATAGAESGAAVVAFTNPGGIRADLIYSAGPGEGDGKVTYEAIFNTQPFTNNLVTMTLTGGQIDALLEQQFSGCYGQNSDQILQVSAGFSYSWRASAPACDKVAMDSIRINGAPIHPKASYRVTVNGFLAEGGDNFAVLQDGADRLGGVRDTDALGAYLKAFSPVAPGPQDRITRVD